MGLDDLYKPEDDSVDEMIAKINWDHTPPPCFCMHKYFHWETTGKELLCRDCVRVDCVYNTGERNKITE